MTGRFASLADERDFLLDSLRDIQDMHRPLPESGGTVCAADDCSACGDPYLMTEWPCLTRQAVDEALGELSYDLG